MYILALSLSLISFLANYCFGFFIGSFGVGFISVFCLLNSLLLSAVILYEVVFLDSGNCVVNYSTWFDIAPYEVQWSFNYDTLSAIMLFMVLFISTNVHIYSLSYMQSDSNRNRFMSLLSLFTFFMLLLVTANNFLQLLLGWEGVGICSYLLINFWSDRIAANKAALKALFFNRVGDFGMFLAIVLVFYFCKTTNFSIVFDMGETLSKSYFISYDIGYYMLNSNLDFLKSNIELRLTYLNFICLLFILAAIAKSAQFFLHGWLADAMEGPTPVSALIHAATMVTAGIFLISKISPLLQYNINMLVVISILGIITTVAFSFSGCYTNDLKKIVASSTASQLAYMFFILGSLDVEASLYHLFLHAFFKALLFLSAGSVIHSLSDEQDIRVMGGLGQLMPFNTFCFLLGSFALIGLPLATGGFYSKDTIVEDTLVISTNNFDDLVNLGSEWGVYNTFYYNLKIVTLVFFGYYRGHFKISGIHDGPLILKFAMGSIVIGTLISPIFWEIFLAEDTYWSQSFAQLRKLNNQANFIYREDDFTSYLIYILLMLGGIVILHISEEFLKTNHDNLNSIYNVTNSKYFYLAVRLDQLRWGLEFIIIKFLVKYKSKVSGFLFLCIDRGFFERIGTYFAINNVRKFNKKFFIFFHTGFIYQYVSIFLISVLFLFLLNSLTISQLNILLIIFTIHFLIINLSTPQSFLVNYVYSLSLSFRYMFKSFYENFFGTLFISVYKIIKKNYNNIK